MLYKLPKDRKILSKDTLLMDRINKLPDTQKNEWYDKYDNYLINIALYEKLLADVSNGNIQPDFVQNKKYLETEIPRQENELLRMLSITGGGTDEEKIANIASILISQGSPNIRPEQGDYSIYKNTNSAS